MNGRSRMRVITSPEAAVVLTVSIHALLQSLCVCAYVCVCAVTVGSLLPAGSPVPSPFQQMECRPYHRLWPTV